LAFSLLQAAQTYCPAAVVPHPAGYRVGRTGELLLHRADVCASKGQCSIMIACLGKAQPTHRAISNIGPRIERAELLLLKLDYLQGPTGFGKTLAALAIPRGGDGSRKAGSGARHRGFQTRSVLGQGQRSGWSRREQLPVRRAPTT
jgi:hypothetical protein